MMPASQEFPLGHDWTRIYLYLGTKVMRAAKRAEIPKDVAVENLDDYERKLLNGLKDWIWEKQEEVLRQRKREAKKASKTLHV